MQINPPPVFKAVMGLVDSHVSTLRHVTLIGPTYQPIHLPPLSSYPHVSPTLFPTWPVCRPCGVVGTRYGWPRTGDPARRSSIGADLSLLAVLDGANGI